MNLKLLFAALLIANVSLSDVNAQILLESDTIFSGITDDYEEVAHNKFTNALPQLKTYRWVRNEVIMPAPWHTLICDKNNCFSGSVDSMEVELGPSASSLLDVHLRLENVFEGYALVELLIKDINNANNSVTAVYVFDSGMTSGLKEVQKMDFNIYPNPSSGLFTIANSETHVSVLEVYSLAGNQLVEFEVAEGQWYDLANLAKGTYIACLKDAKGLLLGTKLITKI